MRLRTRHARDGGYPGTAGAVPLALGSRFRGNDKYGFGLPLLVPIEILSYLSRLISLSVRLFANMMAGHVMLEVFGAFVVMLGAAGVIFWIPAAFSLAVNVALIGFEILVATLQAYVFAVLTCIYLHDAVHLH